MVHSERIFEIVESMISRYGVTLTEIPERFKSKVLHKLNADTEIAAEVELFFKLLLSETIRPVRTKAGSRISQSEYNKVLARAVEFDELDEQSARKLVELWAKAFHVEVRPDQVPVIDQASEITVADFDVSVPDYDFTIKTNDDVERVVNQFDIDVTVEEPQIEDYDPHFEQIDADMSINFVEGTNEEEIPTLDDIIASSAKKKTRKIKSHSASNDPVNLDTATIDDAFKALRFNNFDQASSIMTRLARNGDIRAQFHLGEFYLKGGSGLSVSREKAKYWFNKAASKGSIPARTMLQEMESADDPGGCCGCVAIICFIIFSLYILSAVL